MSRFGSRKGQSSAPPGVALVAVALFLAFSAGRHLRVVEAQTVIQISDVFGLSNELALMVRKGVSYTVNRTPFIGPTGMLEIVPGNLPDCVQVGGTSIPCPGSTQGGGNFVDGEFVGGVVNGANPVFTLANSPNPATSIHLYLQGVRQQTGFSVSGSTITFVSAAVPPAGDVLTADYRY